VTCARKLVEELSDGPAWYEGVDTATAYDRYLLKAGSSQEAYDVIQRFHTAGLDKLLGPGGSSMAEETVDILGPLFGPEVSEDEILAAGWSTSKSWPGVYTRRSTDQEAYEWDAERGAGASPDEEFMNDDDDE